MSVIVSGTRAAHQVADGHAIDTPPSAHHSQTHAAQAACGSKILRMHALDAIDYRLVDLLRADARQRLSDLGEQVNLSTSAVKRRVDRLEASGIITGYRAVIDQSKLGRHLEAFTELTFDGDTKVADISSVAESLPEVQAVFTTAGDPDALVWIRVKDVDDLTRVIDLLRRSGRVTGTKTLIVLRTWTAD
jgi:Lrp/AsnC family transcriptional regulator, leucine-responsive regulatory protein